MAKPVTLLELCEYALSLGARSIKVEHENGQERVCADFGVMGLHIADYASTSAEAEELRKDLYTAAERPLRAILGGQTYTLKTRIRQSSGEDEFKVSIQPAPKSGDEPKIVRGRNRNGYTCNTA